MSVDVFTLTVLQNALIGVAHEMKLMTMRTAYTELWKEQGDLSCCVMDADGEIVAQDPTGFPVHVTTMPFQLRGLIDGVGADTIEPGDVLVTNDPFLGGTHLQDVLIARPVFHDGAIIAYLCNRGHWADIGGMGPGSYSPATTELIQEGLVIPPLKLFRQDQLDTGIVRMIMRNLRNADVGHGDMRAQYASCFSGERRLRAVIERHGAEALKEGMAEILRRSEALTRARIANFADGVYHARDCVDGDGLSPQKQWIDAQVTVAGDSVQVDLSGSSPQSRGGMNCSRASAIAGVQYALKIISDPENPPNAGSYRPIEVITRPGTLCDAEAPGSIVGYGEIVYRVMEATLQAIAPAAPEAIIACGSGSTGTVVIGGQDTRPEARKPSFLTLELSSGAYGARATKDGISGIRYGAGNAGNVPIEADEMQNPLLFERYEIAADTGGAGKFRGGNGFVRAFRVLADRGSICICADRHETPPPGIFGGCEGSLARYVLDPGTENEQVLPSKTGYVPLKAGTLVWLQSAGGGGFGPVADRAPDAVVRDLRDGTLSKARAAEIYGHLPEDVT